MNLSSFLLLLLSLNIPSLLSTGVTRPADTDGGDAPHRAHLTPEHGSAAGRETGQLGGEQRASVRPQAGRLWRLLQQRSESEIALIVLVHKASCF